MGLCYRHLTLDERRQIYLLSEAKVPIRQIAERLGRHRSSIRRELQRNRYEEAPYLDRYSPVTAHGLMATRRRRLGKLYRYPEFAAYVVARLNDACSPEQIAGRLRCDEEISHELCHETIYQCVYSLIGRTDQLYRLLPQGRRRRSVCYTRKPRGLNIRDAKTTVIGLREVIESCCYSG
ncbi:IS30 family transposase (plasmid) [Lichenicola cladoniae]|uniref:IS30 family transposase n=1 Tax=Lichenicola cladoniae TaxID=1484109 RepID=A0A6M8HYY9_9PROT|nr:helix-turn-helix domain-containing protein [Lichenicola cladoniae]NPD70058.1 IS30 family transposase [Acetobacteraceae bacterium]QKE93437.1 IS30 family transposase [Lichenicola cladoniae]